MQSPNVEETLKQLKDIPGMRSLKYDSDNFVLNLFLQGYSTDCQFCPGLVSSFIADVSSCVNI